MQVKRMVGESLFKLAKTRGYEVIPFWKMDAVPLVNHLRKLLEQYKIEVVLDVGANKGQYHDLLRQEVGFQGEILSFEPVSKYHKMLKARSVEDPLWQIYDFALGSEPGEAEINVTQSPGLNSFLSPRTDVVDGFWKEGSIVATEKVKIRTLSEVLGEAGIDCATRGVYLKLDTQGFDLEVIKGAGALLNDIRALQTEASIRPIYNGMPSYIEAVNILNERGFDLSGMFPVTHDDALRLVELDFVFINSRFA
jgi:FkbM family methyltransferase